MRLLLILLLLVACRDRTSPVFTGIPAGVATRCARVNNAGTLWLCIGAGVSYACVSDYRETRFDCAPARGVIPQIAPDVERRP